MKGKENPAFTSDDVILTNGKFSYNNGDFNMKGKNYNETSEVSKDTSFSNLETDKSTDQLTEEPERDQWGNGLEFLMSCIAMSVGLGNVWRFPFVALENGGGAFLIPYLIVLFLVGKPIYYLEMLMGQFSSRGSVKVYDMAPAMRGTGFGQLVAVALLCTYYGSLMGLIGSYLIDSFKSPLPWGYCRDEWNHSNCLPSLSSDSTPNNGSQKAVTSSELYFLKEVLKEKDTIDDGIGYPNGALSIALVISWLLVLIVLVKGIKSSGKASYFLALFPYVIMIVLLIRAVTLPGADLGILYFLKPQWDKLLSGDVWYAAVTQVFFSLSVSFGNIIMYASYNRFTHNVYRDVTIVTILDTFTSLIAGLTIFGILGNLAYQIGTTDIGNVVKGGTGLAFISYPDAIAKFEWLPQLFSVLFFLMLFVLGIGSNVAMASCIMTVIRDRFPQIKHVWASCIVALFGLSFGLVYVTPGGQYILNLVDFYGAGFIAFILAIAELITVGWIYGVNRFCRDTEFMTGRYPGIYWRICWGFITPVLMMSILIYTFVTFTPVTYKDYVYSDTVYAIGWCISALGIMQLPLWAIYAIFNQKGTICERIKSAFSPMANWGPIKSQNLADYKLFLENQRNVELTSKSFIHRIKQVLYRTK